jgi:hypothetical protein
MIVEFIDTESKHRARYVDVDETAPVDVRDRSTKLQVEGRDMKISRIRTYRRAPAETRGKL